MDFSSDLLVESKSAREQGIGELKAQHSEEQVLNKVKQLFFAVWKDVGRVTRQQVADFYEVSIDSVKQNYTRHEDEFKLDGVEILRGNDLKEVKDILSLTSFSPQETIYTPAGVLRMGFILRDSEVAKTVRTIAIRFIQGVGQQLNSQVVLQSLTQSYPVLKEFVNKKEAIRVSSPLSRYSEVDRSSFIKKHPLGYPYILPKLPTASNLNEVTPRDIQDQFQLLASYTDSFLLRGDKELKIQLNEDAARRRYPHLTSNVFQFVSTNGVEKAVIMFQFHNIVVDYDFLQECISRSYLQFAKDFLGVNYAYLILVAPLGATPEASKCIKSNHLSSDYRDYVGVLTVKELANFLLGQAMSARKEGTGTIKGRINSKFKEFLRDPFEAEQGSIFDFFEESPEAKQIT